MKVLVTGGTGYIGSHTVVELLGEGYEVDVLDNLANSKREVLDRIFEITGKKPGFFEVDLLDFPAVRKVFAEGGYDLVVHFAGLKVVTESIEKPLEYYENNVGGTVNLLKCMGEYGVKKLVFSSSASVYGEEAGEGVSEERPAGRGITSPYGETKYVIEKMIRAVAAADVEFSATILRYFNPVGNHPSGVIGEDPTGAPGNLMAMVMRVYRGEAPELLVYGDDYETADGTAVRDFIHVVDLARGHIEAIAAMGPGVSVYNLGTGRGTTVFEMVRAFEEASGEKLPVRIVPRRAGDLAVCYADVEKARRELGWEAEFTIEDAMRDTLKFLKLRKD